MKADLLQARSKIESLENVVKQLHNLRREAEQVFDNEKGALKLELNEQGNMVGSLDRSPTFGVSLQVLFVLLGMGILVEFV